MRQQINYSVEDLEQYYSNRIAMLEVQSARERASKNALIRYVEELEAKVEDLEKQLKGGENE